MRVSQAPIYRRRRRVAAAVVGVVGLGAGFGAAAGFDALRGAPAEAAEAEASASPGVEASEGTLAVAAAPSPSTTPSPTATTAPVASSTPDPEPTFDTAAHSLTDPDSIWVIVNKLNPVDPQDHVPDDLVHPEGTPGGATLRAEAADAMARMRADAVEAGASFTVSTAYRSYEMQSTLYHGYVGRSGQESADRFSARPGYSEHQTGLAADLHNGADCDLRACFAATAAGLWVAEHAHEYGYIVRYPEGKESVTGYIYEPWHVRYVGEDLAQEMRSTGITTMEEFFDLPDAGAYAS